MPSKVREEVMAELTAFIFAANARGEDGYKAAERAFPGVPDTVLILAMLDADEQKTEAWWQTVERTIDGEIIRNALAPKTEDAPCP